MSTKDEILELKQLVDQLREADRDLRVYGASVHEYNIGPTLSWSELSDFEQRHKITLPEDYRLWLNLVGSGKGGDIAKVQKNPWYYAGAGPFNGIYPLHDELFSKNAHLPFPFTESTHLSDEQYDEWDISNDVHVPGLLEIASQGCAGTVRLFASQLLFPSALNEWEIFLDLVAKKHLDCIWFIKTRKCNPNAFWRSAVSRIKIITGREIFYLRTKLLNEQTEGYDKIDLSKHTFRFANQLCFIGQTGDRNTPFVTSTLQLW